MKKKLLPYGIIIAVGLLAVLIGMKQGALFGSTVDWLNQHTVYPDYFRNLFYETGTLFPNLAQHLGAGQNIFNFAYYGLFNPIILISYLLPMIKMIDYLQLVSIIGFISSGCLCYYWLKQNFKENISIIGSLFLLLAVPLLFHAHRHFMFVSYMPFLIMALIGVDRHFKGHSLLLSISILLMILTSYFYSVGGLVVIVIYGIYQYLTNNEKINIKDFLKAGIKFSIPIIIGILLSAFLLLPVLNTMLSNHTRVNDSVDIIGLIIPKLNLGAILYGSYAIGLTGIAVLSLIYLLTTKKKNTIFLGIILIAIVSLPIFRYLLNGALYVKNKSLIPFLPLFVLTITIFLKQFLKERKKLQISIFVMLLIGFYFYFLGHSLKGYYFDFLTLIILVYISYRFKNIYLLVIPTLIGSFILTTAVSQTDTFVTKELYNEITNPNINELMKNDTHYRTQNLINVGENINRIYPSYGTSIYSSTYNLDYHLFYKDIFSLAMPSRNTFMNASTDNFLFQTFMGVKYLISNNNVSSNYEKIEEKNNIYLYENKKIYPLGYARSKTISEKDYLNLTDSERMEAIFYGIITESSSELPILKGSYQEILTSLKDTKLKVIEEENKIKVEVDKPTTIVLPLKQVLQNKVLILDFDLLEKPKCSNGDISITINNVTNKLTCKEWGYNNENTKFHYVIAEDNIGTLTITFTKGIFYLNNLNSYVVDQNDITSTISELNEWKINEKRSKGDSITGTIDVTSDSYFATSIPYDKGFKAYIDGEEVEIEKVNTSFIGFKINKGKHIVKLVYEAPLFTIGKWTSLWGVVGLILLVAFEHKKINTK